MKIVYNLGKNWAILRQYEAKRWVTAGKKTDDINVGEVVRKTEEDFHVVECFKDHDNCVHFSCMFLKVCSK